MMVTVMLVIVMIKMMGDAPTLAHFSETQSLATKQAKHVECVPIDDILAWLLGTRWHLGNIIALVGTPVTILPPSCLASVALGVG